MNTIYVFIGAITISLRYFAKVQLVAIERMLHWHLN